MKLYIVMQKGKSHPFKLESWVDVEKIGNNSIYVKSIRAFIKMKDAKKWINDNKYTHSIIRKAIII